jgi:type IV secretion system protein VirB2
MIKFPVPARPSRSHHRAVLSLALLTTTMALAPQLAYAQSAAPVEGILDWFVGVLQGNVARSLAIIAVCFLGFLFLTGRMAWQGAISIIIGIAIIFGAAQLVDAMKSSAGV